MRPSAASSRASASSVAFRCFSQPSMSTRCFATDFHSAPCSAAGRAWTLCAISRTSSSRSSGSGSVIAAAKQRRSCRTTAWSQSARPLVSPVTDSNRCIAELPTAKSLQTGVRSQSGRGRRMTMAEASSHSMSGPPPSAAALMRYVQVRVWSTPRTSRRFIRSSPRHLLTA